MHITAGNWQCTWARLIMCWHVYESEPNMRHRISWCFLFLCYMGLIQDHDQQLVLQDGHFEERNRLRIAHQGAMSSTAIAKMNCKSHGHSHCFWCKLLWPMLAMHPQEVWFGPRAANCWFLMQDLHQGFFTHLWNLPVQQQQYNPWNRTVFSHCVREWGSLTIPICSWIPSEAPAMMQGSLKNPFSNVWEMRDDTIAHCHSPSVLRGRGLRNLN